MPEDHGDRERALKDGGNLHPPEDFIGHGRAQLHLRHLRALQPRRHGARQDGQLHRQGAVGQAPQARRQVLPQVVGQPQGQGSAEAVPPRPAQGHNLPPDPQGRPVHRQLAQQADEEPAGPGQHGPAAAHPWSQRPPEVADSGNPPAAAADAASDVNWCGLPM